MCLTYCSRCGREATTVGGTHTIVCFKCILLGNVVERPDVVPDAEVGDLGGRLNPITDVGDLGGRLNPITDVGDQGGRSNPFECDESSNEEEKVEETSPNLTVFSFVSVGSLNIVLPTINILLSRLGGIRLFFFRVVIVNDLLDVGVVIDVTCIIVVSPLIIFLHLRTKSPVYTVFKTVISLDN